MKVLTYKSYILNEIIIYLIMDFKAIKNLQLKNIIKHIIKRFKDHL